MLADRIILIGLRGSGKTTLGRALAASLRPARDFVDLDDLTPGFIPRPHDRPASPITSIAEAFSLAGEPAFRDAEARALEHVLSAQPTPYVLALGGGTPTAPGAAQRLHALKHAPHPSTVIIYLRAAAATLRDRLSTADNAHRPSLTGRPVLEEIEHILAARDALYRSIADRTIDVDRLSPDAALAALTAACAIAAP